jgi:Zn-finger nucleic acid-binding protein
MEYGGLLMFDKKYGEELLLCPRCKIKMKKIKKRNVILDVCRTCKGMWLDDKEIEKLVMIAGNNDGKKEV